jgi:hypothetical protein
MTTQLDVRPTDPDLDEGEGRVAHIIHSRGKAGGKVLEAFVEGTPVEALCGKVFVPSRDPKPLPVCSRCKAIKDEIQGLAP